MAKEDKVKTPKSAKKSKDVKDVKAKGAEPEAVPYVVRMKAVTTISKPMADEKKVIVSQRGVHWDGLCMTWLGLLIVYVYFGSGNRVEATTRTTVVCSPSLRPFPLEQLGVGFMF